MKFRPGQHVRAILDDTATHTVTAETFDGMGANYVITRPADGGLPDLWHLRDLRAA